MRPHACVGKFIRHRRHKILEFELIQFLSDIHRSAKIWARAEGSPRVKNIAVCFRQQLYIIRAENCRLREIHLPEK